MGHQPSHFAPLDPDLEDENKLVALIPILLRQIRTRIPHEPSPASTSILTGRMYVEESLAGNQNIFRTVARMDKQSFARLVILLRSAGLQDTPHISVEEKILVHIQVCVGLSNRQIAHRFQHSGQTGFKIVREILVVMRYINQVFMVVPDENTPTSSVISDNPKFAAFFGNCIGALDGTMIPAVVTGADAAGGAFRNRKGVISQNVLGVVNFDMTFQYILGGWEGSAHDSRVLMDAKDKGLPFVLGKFHLGDAGYALTMRCLVPYRGVRYHLKVCFLNYSFIISGNIQSRQEWERAGLRPANKEELFNLRHASLRNVIERAYGVIKKRFPALRSMASYPFHVQVDIVMSCFMLHNFIRRNKEYNDEFDVLDDGDFELNDADF